jgi:hypothetical protein
VLAEEMLVEASLLEPVDGLAGIREADDVGEPAAQRGRGVAERAAVDQMLHRMDLRHVLELTHVATKPRLNQLSGNPVPAPECLQPGNATNIFVEAGTTEAGPTAGSAELPVGVTNWECCVHPWMRMTIDVH